MDFGSNVKVNRNRKPTTFPAKVISMATSGGTSRRADRFRGGIVERGSSLLRPKKTGPLINGVCIYYAKFAFSHF
jgi:hypothetical protein